MLGLNNFFNAKRVHSTILTEQNIPNKTIEQNTRIVKTSKPSYTINNTECDIVLSIATTPYRFEKLIENIQMFENISNIYKVVINMCISYKRFGINTDINKINIKMIEEINLKYKEDKYVIFIIDDYGPITKLIGGYFFCNLKNITDKKLIIIDDDTEYTNEQIHNLYFSSKLYDMNSKYQCVLGNCGFNIDTTNQFLYKKLDYISNKFISETMIIEGFAGIIFNLDYIKNILQDIEPILDYYKVICWNKSFDYLPNNFLICSFLGDDFVISHMFKNNDYKLYVLNDTIPTQYNYGFNKDALHKNTNSDTIVKTVSECSSNMKSYYFLHKNMCMFNVFKNKKQLCKEIKNKTL